MHIGYQIARQTSIPNQSAHLFIDLNFLQMMLQDIQLLFLTTKDTVIAANILSTLAAPTVKQ